MRHLFMPAVRAVSMCAIVALALMVWSAAVRVRGADRDGMLVDMTVMDMVQVPVMEVVGMPFMTYRCVTAIRTVHVTVRRVFSALSFLHTPSFRDSDPLILLNRPLEMLSAVLLHLVIPGDPSRFILPNSHSTRIVRHSLRFVWSNSQQVLHSAWIDERNGLIKCAF
jgi:hypothetical protein